MCLCLASCFVTPGHLHHCFFHKWHHHSHVSWDAQPQMLLNFPWVTDGNKCSIRTGLYLGHIREFRGFSENSENLMHSSGYFIVFMFQICQFCFCNINSQKTVISVVSWLPHILILKLDLISHLELFPVCFVFLELGIQSKICLMCVLCQIMTRPSLSGVCKSQWSHCFDWK